MTSAGRPRVREWLIRLTWGGLAVAWLLAPAVHADRSSQNMDPAYMFEKAGQFDKAAMYYQRVLRGLRETYISFHWNGDPAANAAGKYATEYVDLPKEIEERLADCLGRAKPAPEQVRRMEFLNYLWMTELVDEEGGGQRTACNLIAPEAERLGDFRMAEFLRRGEARYYRVVAMPFHEKCAAEFEAAGQKDPAACHRLAAKACEARARRADLLALGDKALMALPRLGGPDRYIGLSLYPAKVNPVDFQAIHQRFYTKEGQSKGVDPGELATTLKGVGLKHADENVRLSAVVTLARLGEKEAVLSALDDSSAVVRLAAAEALAAVAWADGWAACRRHSDAGVQAAVAALLKPAGKEPLARTWAVAELIRGLGSSSAKTAAFCQAALEQVTGRKMAAGDWAAWWKGLGNPRPGLARQGSDGKPVVDETLDFGTWWQSTYQRLANPLTAYAPPVTIKWEGYLVVPRPGEYRFYARNVGEGKRGANQVNTPGRVGFPGLYLSAPSAKVEIDGSAVLPHPPDAVQDPDGGVRLDFGEPVRLTEGLHKMRVEFEYRSKPDGFWNPQPSLRLYWSSDVLPRQVIPADRLVSKDSDAK